MTTHDYDRLWRMLESQGAQTRASAEQLARLETRMERVQAALEDLARGPGSRPSCVEHESRLDYVESSLDTLCARLWWLVTVAGTGVSLLGFKALWEVLRT